MRPLLDTTYFLPAIGISVKSLAGNAVIKLISEGQRILISEVTIFELSAKGGKQVATKNLEAEKVVKGLRAITSDWRIERIPVYDVSILLTAFKLREVLDDSIDCIILSSGINQADELITEDKDIQNLMERGGLRTHSSNKSYIHNQTISKFTKTPHIMKQFTAENGSRGGQ
nr:PIN domain-containing protein [Candidatus Freyarchaeota archaeon]